jgi:hypothetical protein
MLESADNTLAYMDQGSYLALRALGRGPVIQYTWIYERGVDLDGLRRFHRNLSGGLLGRVLETSSIPCGRHHWVAWPGPGELNVADVEIGREKVWDWVEQRANTPVDPEFGPPWHLGVQPFVGGGAAVNLVVSHTVADAAALILSINDAVVGTGRDLNYPPPRSRPLRAALLQDTRTAIGSLGAIPAAVAGAARTARLQAADLTDSARSAAAVRTSECRQPVVVPTVSVAIDLAEWNARAKALNGTSNVLLAGVATRIGAITGRVDDNGMAMLSLPVSERTEGDTRGNALNTITVIADPQRALSDLGEIRRGIKTELTRLGANREWMLAPLALTPFTPKSLLKRLEKLVLKVGKPIGSSNTGDMPEAVNRPDGTDADFFTSRLVEPGITAADFDRIGGRMMLASGNLHGKVCMSVVAWEPGAVNTKAALMDSVKRALDDYGLAPTVME